MRKSLSYVVAVVMFVMLALPLGGPAAERGVKADGQTLQEKCDNCMQHVQQRFDQCLAVHGQDHIPCYDQFNDGVVNCFRNFCEQ